MYYAEFYDSKKYGLTQGSSRVELYDDFRLQTITLETSVYNPDYSIEGLKEEGGNLAFAIEDYLN